MHSILIHYQFHSDPAPVTEFHRLLIHTYGGAVQHVASGSLLIDTRDEAEAVYQLISHLFTFDDKLFVAQVNDFRSLHQISRPRSNNRREAM